MKAKLDKISSKVKSLLDGKPARAVYFDEWLFEKPIKFQNELLGEQQASLYRQGKITINDLTNQDHQPLSTKDLITLATTGSINPKKRIYREGENGLTLIERSILETSLGVGLKQNKVITSFLDKKKGIIINLDGMSPTLEQLEQLRDFKEACMLRNALNDDIVTPQEIRLLASLSNVDELKVVTVDGAVVKIIQQVDISKSEASEFIDRFNGMKGSLPSAEARLRRISMRTGFFKITKSYPKAVIPRFS